MYASILSAAGKILLSMVLPLVTEKALKALVIMALEKVAKRTENEVDDNLVKIVKDAWNEASVAPKAE